MTANIDFYFDFSSPYSYLAAQRIDRLAEENGARATWKPIMLGAVFKAVGGAPNEHVAGKREYMRMDCPRMARQMGAPFAWPDSFPTATLAAARGFYWLRDTDPDKAVSFAKACFDKYFGEGLDITPKETVAGIASGLGVDKDAYLAAVADDAVKRKVKDMTDEAIERKAFGAPTFFVDTPQGVEMVWGSDRLWMIKRMLAGKCA